MKVLSEERQGARKKKLQKLGFDGEVEERKELIEKGSGNALRLNLMENQLGKIND